MKNIKLHQALKALRAAQNKLDQLPDALERTEAAIRDDPELTPEQQKHRITKAREEAVAAHRKLYAQLLNASETATDAARSVRTARAIEPEAQARIRDLLDRQRMAPGQVLDRAVQLRDDEMVAALRAELLWFGLDGRFEDASETIAACDRALADVGLGSEAENNRAVVELGETLPTAKAVAEFSGKAVTGTITPYDRLEKAYATGEGRQTESEDD
jgi:hypothetical protein